jgi:hypothetical protein
VFFDPILFLINVLRGAKIIYATENTERIKATSFESRSSELSPFSDVHYSPFLLSMYVGIKDATFYIIILPIHRANKH